MAASSSRQINVFVRLRPLNDAERLEGDEAWRREGDDALLEVLDHARAERPPRAFRYDRVFCAATGNAAVYFRRADHPQTGRGDAAAATWTFRGDSVAATPRPRR